MDPEAVILLQQDRAAIVQEVCGHDPYGKGGISQEKTVNGRKQEKDQTKPVKTFIHGNGV